MKNLLKVLSFIEAYEFDADVQRVSDAWIAEWKSKPTAGELRAAKAELESFLQAARPFVEAFEMHKNDAPISKRKVNMSLNIQIEEWERLAEVLSAVEVM